MKKNLFLLMLTALVLAGCGGGSASSDGADLCDYVNPFIGTGGHGHVFLGANVPFGFVQLGPTEKGRGWDWCSGYHYSDSTIIGFSHLHLSGTGCGDLGDIAFLPTDDPATTEYNFTHEQETVSPGYYKLDLDDPDIVVELTATKRVGMHRYTFSGDEGSAYVLVDLNQGRDDRMTEFSLKQDDEVTISGYRKSQGWAPNQEVYFTAKFSAPVTLVDSTANKPVACFEVKDKTQPLLVKVALSPVSSENAQLNMDAECEGWDFDKVVADARKAWNEELQRIQIETDDETQRQIFYTAMYHLMVAPSEYCDVNGEYRGSDGKVYKGDFTNYTTLSLWDTYRAFHPLMTLIYPEKQADYAKTFVKIYEQQGRLPIWHLMGNETDCMVGSSAVPVLADLVLKGFVEDKEAAFEAMKNSQMQDIRSLGLLKQYGYIPYDLEPENETVAKALEYCADEAGLAKVAKLLGHDDDYEYFYNRSQSYSKYFDKSINFMRAVDSKGQFRPDFDPIKVIHRADDYTEGNAWQYVWLVPHDVHGLVSLFGSEEAFVEKLDSLFVVEGDLGEEASPDISGLIGQYAHGNEPSHQILYMYNYVGQPWKGAKLIREVMETMYKADFDGLSGNEDVGQMSAWYITSALGLYQVEPSGGKYIIGTPLFNKATMKVGNGKKFTVVAKDNSRENIYVQSVKLNGKPYTKSYIDFTDIVKGGTLELVMGSQPSDWGTAEADRP